MRFLLSLTVVVSFVFSLRAGSDPEGARMRREKDVFGERVFIENKGQFNKSELKETVLYAYDNGDERIYFTRTGLIYEMKPGSKESKKKSGYVHMNWKNSSHHIQLEAREKEEYYYSYGPAKFNSKVYKKLIYKNVYPHIDVEYVFPEDKDCGIEYNFILSPGANIKDIKVAYTGAVEELRMTYEGNIVIKTSFEDIIEHAPHSFFYDKKPVKSGFLIENNMIGFFIEGTDELVAQHVVIDPWVTNTSTTSVQMNAGFDVDYDDLHNTYVYGARNAQHCRVAKYNPAGALQWVFMGQIPPAPSPAVWTSGGPNKYAGNFVVDKQNSIIYLGQPRTGSGTSVAALNSSGNYNGFMTPTITWFDEIWDMTYNCKTGKMFVFGGSTTSNPNASNPIGGLLNVQSTKIDTISLYLGNGNHSIANHAIDESGNLFVIFGEGSSSMKNHIARFDKDFSQAHWKTNSGFTALNGMSTRSSYVVTMNSMAYNCLAVNNYYLFYYDGVHLAAYNKITGAQMGSRTLTHLNQLQQGGIAVDDCNNVYVGGRDSILCFSFSYNYSSATGTFVPATGIALNLANVSTNKYVYDLKFERAANTLHFSGSGFVGQEHVQYNTCHGYAINPDCSAGGAVVTFTDNLNILNSFTYTSIVTPTLELSYTWVNTANNTTVHTTSGAINSSTYSSSGQYNVVVGPVGSCYSQAFNFTSYPSLSCPGQIIASNGFVGLGNTATNVFTVNTCSSFPLTFTAQCQALTSYTWNFGDGSPTASGTNQSHSYTNPGTYSLIINAQASPQCASITQTYVLNVVNCSGSGTTSCCSNMTINTNLNYFSNTTYTASICPLSSFTLSVNCPAALLYTVNFGDGSANVTTTSTLFPSHTYATPGTYDLTITSNGPGCSTVKTITVTSFYSNACPPCCSVSIISSNAPWSITGVNLNYFTICAYGKFQGTANCSSATSYTWDYGDGSSTFVGSTTPLHSYNYTAPSSQYTMTTKVQGPTCYQEVSSVILVNETWCKVCCPAIGLTGPGVSSYVTPTASGCPLKAINLSGGCAPSNTSPSNYTVNFGAGAGNQIGSGNTYNYNYMYNNPGTYSIVVRQTGPTNDNRGCVSNQTIAFSAAYSLCPSCCTGNFITGVPSSQCLVSGFNGVANCGSGTSYNWNFGDNTTASGSSVNKFYSAPGLYTVSALALGTNSCASTQSIPITVSYSSCPSCCVPNSSITIGGTGLQNLSQIATNVFKANVCLTTPINLNASNCSAATTYTWNFGDGPVNYTGANAPQHYYASPGNYSLVVSAFSQNCYQTQTIVVTASGTNCAACCQQGFMSASGAMTVQTTATPYLFTAKVCPSKSFTITASCPNATAYTWSGTGGLSGTGPVLVYTYNGQSSSIITYTAKGPNCYTTFTINADVSYTNCAPCCTVAPIVGTGFQYLNTVNPNNQYAGGICPTGVFNLSGAVCSPGNIYNWDFGDGSPSSTNANVTHQYNTPGVYTVTMSVMSTVGCYQTMTLTIDNSYVNCQPCCQTGYVTGTGLNNLTATGLPNVYTAYACINSPINLSAAGCSAANSYTWDFGNGSSLINTVAANGQYSSIGNYTILVKAAGPLCTAPTQTICVTVTGSQMVFPQPACTGKMLMASNVCSAPGGATYSWDFGDGSSSPGSIVFHNYNSAGTYTVQLAVSVGGSPYATYSETLQIDPCAPPDPCTNCIGSFAPEPGDYVVSLWVREDIVPIPTTYSNAKIHISFTGHSSSYTFGTNVAKNKVIEGWQRIEENFSIPAGATYINLRLLNTNSSTIDAYFDDIRIFPKNGQMKTYVYDPITLKLSAVLDENNYATIYEYDEEGKLLRVKKETERGVMTIQESRESLKKR